MRRLFRNRCTGFSTPPFFVTALCFWLATLGVRARTAGIGLALFSLFATALHTGFLGILITFAREPLYSYDGKALSDWGISALEDQQLAGLVMRVPGGLIYAVAAVVLLGLWLGRAGVDAYKGDSSPFPHNIVIPEAARSGAVRDP